MKRSLRITTASFVLAASLALPIALWRALREGWKSWWYVLSGGLLYGSIVGSASRAGSPKHAHTRLEIERQAWIANGGYVVLAEQVVGLGIDRQPGQQVVAAAEIEACPTIIEVPVWEQ